VICIYVNKVKANSQAALAACELAFFCTGCRYPSAYIKIVLLMITNKMNSTRIVPVLVNAP
jgi:hypothetical protein